MSPSEPSVRPGAEASSRLVALVTAGIGATGSRPLLSRVLGERSEVVIHLSPDQAVIRAYPGQI
jgi:hypothetical protein